MKKILILILSLLISTPIYSADLNKTIKFGWDQDAETLAVMTKWELHWSETAGGGYVKSTDIPYTGGGTGSYTSDVPLVISGQVGDTVTKYFVLRACTSAKCSEFSNEVSQDFVIPLGAPFTFTIEVIVD
jgi:hypothetical protein